MNKQILFRITSLAILLLGAGHLSAQPPGAEPLQPPTGEYDQPGALSSAQFLPPEVLSGSLHTVDPQCYADGLHITFYIHSEGRLIQVTGTRQTIERVHEIYAIQTLRQFSGTEEFTQGLAEAGEKTVGGLVTLVTHPVSTVKNVPKGASRFFGSIGESLKGGSSEMEGSATDALLGIDKARMEIAAELRVNPYSTNQELQELLTSVSQAKAAGGLIVQGGTSLVGGPVGGVITAGNVSGTLMQTLTTTPPSQLRIQNRKNLLELGLNREQADYFLMHPWYSPWQETIIAEALYRIKHDPSAFLGEATRAMTPEDAAYFTSLAVLLARYHESVSPLQSLGIIDGRITALDAGNQLIVPVSLDYALWTPTTQARVDHYLQMIPTDNRYSALVLLTDGKASPKTIQQLAQRRITMIDKALSPGG